jgi:hypothetical protein
MLELDAVLLRLLDKLAKIPAAVLTTFVDESEATGFARSVCDVRESKETHDIKEDGRSPRSPPEHNDVIVCKYERDKESTPRGAWSAAALTFERTAAFIKVMFARASGKDSRLLTRLEFREAAP